MWLKWLKSLLSFEANTLFKGRHLWISVFCLEMYCPAWLRGQEYIWLHDGSFSYVVILLKWKLTGYCTTPHKCAACPQITRSAIIFAFIRFCCERKMWFASANCLWYLVWTLNRSCLSDWHPKGVSPVVGASAQSPDLWWLHPLLVLHPDKVSQSSTSLLHHQETSG